MEIKEVKKLADSTGAYQSTKLGPTQAAEVRFLKSNANFIRYRNRIHAYLNNGFQLPC